MSIEITAMAMNAIRAANAAQIEAERLRIEWVAALTALRSEVAHASWTPAHFAAKQTADKAREDWAAADAAAKTAVEKARVESCRRYLAS
jgi:hypothetical protein